MKPISHKLKRGGIYRDDIEWKVRRLGAYIPSNINHHIHEYAMLGKYLYLVSRYETD